MQQIEPGGPKMLSGKLTGLFRWSEGGGPGGGECVVVVVFSAASEVGKRGSNARDLLRRHP